MDNFEFVNQIHTHPGKIVLVTAGAGTDALATLLGVAGASNTLLEARVPYTKEAFIDFVGREPAKFASTEAACLLAGGALRRAHELVGYESEPLFGVSCAAAVATTRPKKGPHHAFVAVWSLTQIASYGLVLTKGARSRAEEEALVSDLLLTAVGEAFGVPYRPLALLPHEKVVRTVTDLGQAVDQLLAGEVPFVGVYDHGRVRTTDISPQVLLSGSFNPLHYGHKKLADVASRQLGKPVAFEISVTNVDKPPLAQDDVLRRLSQFAGRHPLYLTNAPRFVDKARLFPETTFVIGADTAVRLVDPCYYENDTAVMHRALDELAAHKAHFLVAGRKHDDNIVLQLADIAIPAAHRPLFTPIPLDEFHVNLSSTALRAAHNQNHVSKPHDT